MLHKKGDRQDPGNYRPIALACTEMKLFTYVLCQRLTKWADENAILPEAQAGFRKSRSCQEQVFNLTGAIQIHLRKEKRRAYALFIDFARAFPSVPHDKLWKKLYDLGVSSKIIAVLQNLYASATTVIRLHEGHSEPIEMTLGLLQGNSLSPLLFALYISDIEKVLLESQADGLAVNHYTQVHVLLFADDAVLLAPNVGALRRKIEALEIYFDSLSLSVNIEKTKVVIFRKGRRIE